MKFRDLDNNHVLNDESDDKWTGASKPLRIPYALQFGDTASPGVVVAKQKLPTTS
jgi:hypothetical protein